MDLREKIIEAIDAAESASDDAARRRHIDQLTNAVGRVIAITNCDISYDLYQLLEEAVGIVQHPELLAAIHNCRSVLKGFMDAMDEDSEDLVNDVNVQDPDTTPDEALLQAIFGPHAPARLRRIPGNSSAIFHFGNLVMEIPNPQDGAVRKFSLQEQLYLMGMMKKEEE